MHSLATIIRINEQAGDRARRKRIKPYVLKSQADVDSLPGGPQWDGKRGYPFPYIGNAVPNGWWAAHDEDAGADLEFFVDSTGKGHDDEPALTWQHFTRELIGIYEQHPEYGYAITEAGPFQVYINAWKPAPKQRRRSGG